MALGVSPPDGFALPDGVWLKGVTQGHNSVAQNGLTAAGTTQATATAIPPRTRMVEFDTVAASTGAYLPPALVGVEILIYNNGAQTLTLYPAIANGASGVQDTINNTTSFTVASHVSAILFCVKAGVWAAK